jgi:hypothetical protein
MSAICSVLPALPWHFHNPTASPCRLLARVASANASKQQESISFLKKKQKTFSRWLTREIRTQRWPDRVRVTR